ncbi:MULTISPECIES: nucleoid occlusion factor SlmA [unclassified Polynucleobacter]|jgi:TetR/AcrR family transcriptional regulator|uniref:nucleoid occlusion factor SlmA n=1 Tax=unclassified Polynucleobacter TaxID=2640945 RepID=UPI001C0E4132|nr:MULTISPECIES: nucleoid occlusion factor SlmA [unclassified Polynucleobacter]MBU3638131.1 nucleoid occlusion factor SlmA [Polynucleobacter sp. AP-RePozz3-80-G7]MEA9600541.1 nucleoid occlusion factor SlmA [Polynucleobacter sp. MG-28-Ekke-A2]
MSESLEPVNINDSNADAGVARKRPRPGERRLQILQVLAEMLQNPKAERVTTAALAAKIEVSEAALYRHFASKAQMFEGLISFIEQTVFGLINQINQKEESGLAQARGILQMLLFFAEKNPGMTRVLLGDALLQEDDRLQERITQVLDRVEASLKQALRIAQTQGGNWAQLGQEEVSIRAAMLMSFVLGRWHRFARSGFKKLPTEASDVSLRLLLSE